MVVPRLKISEPLPTNNSTTTCHVIKYGINWLLSALIPKYYPSRDLPGRICTEPLKPSAIWIPLLPGYGTIWWVNLPRMRIYLYIHHQYIHWHHSPLKFVPSFSTSSDNLIQMNAPLHRQRMRDNTRTSRRLQLPPLHFLFLHHPIPAGTKIWDR